MRLRMMIYTAVFAALTSILAKVGIEGVGSNLATALRTMGFTTYKIFIFCYH